MAAEPIETTAAANRNKAIVSALCNRFSLDPNKFTSESIGTSDIMSFLTKILQLPGSEVPLKNQPEVITWVEFASNFPSESEACHATLRGLNENLAQKTVLLGHGFHPSEADIVVFPTLHAFVSCLSEADKQKYPNVIRWMDYIQQKEDFGGSLAKIVVNKPGFEHFDKYVEKTGVDQTSNKVPATSKDIAKSNKSISSVKGAAEEEASMDDKTIVDLKKHIKDTKEKKAAVDPKKDVKETKEKKAAVDPKKDVKETKEKKAAVDPKKDVKETKEKKKQPEKESSEKDAESSVTILNIRVGLIRKAWKHPSADSLLVEEIDLGDGNLCQVVSGLAKYCSPEDLTNRRVVLITNVKPGKLRDVMSTGLVLCASSGDHSVVEPLIPPEGAIVGECITFLGYEGKPEDVLNPKKKQLEKITPHLYTDDKGIATYKGVPFMTSAGPCTSSISSAGIK